MSRDSGNRAAGIREGLRATGTIILLAVILDVAYQITVLEEFYPGEALIVGVTLGLVPYVLIRGLAPVSLASAEPKGGEDFVELIPVGAAAAEQSPEGRAQARVTFRDGIGEKRKGVPGLCEPHREAIVAQDSDESDEPLAYRFASMSSVASQGPQCGHGSSHLA